MKKICILALLIVSSSLMAETNLEISNSSYFGLGLSAQSLSSSAVSASALTPTIDYRHAFDHPKWSMKASATPLFSSSFSLIGIGSFLGGGYKVWGSSSKKISLNDDNDSILSYESKATKWVGYIDLGLGVTPVFGTNNTSTYSGPQLGLSLYQLSAKYPLEYSLFFSQQNSGEKDVTVLGLSVLYVTQIR